MLQFHRQGLLASKRSYSVFFQPTPREYTIMNQKLSGLIAAPHTPFTEKGELNTSVVPLQAKHFRQTGVRGVFAGGTTGESLSLSHVERVRLIQRWSEVGNEHDLKVIAHVGGNSLPEAQELAAASEKSGVDAIAAFAPNFFRPADVPTLVEYCRLIASSAPNTPFYYYHIPSMTNVYLSMVEYLEHAVDAIPTLAGLKFTHSDLCEELECVNFHDRRFEVLHGFDETLIGGLSVGVTGAVGSTYNYAAPLYNSLIESFHNDDLERAKELQRQSAAMVRVIQKYGFMAGSKAIMSFFDVDCGPVRRPLVPLSSEQIDALRADLDAIGFFT